VKLSVLIPVYNEVRTIDEILRLVAAEKIVHIVARQPIVPLRVR
jgi:glycosyltransferase involved in cell wall biosynthesis